MSQSYLSWVGIASALSGVSILTGHPDWGFLTGAVLILTGVGIVIGTGPRRTGAGDEPKAQRVSNNLVTLSSAAIIAVYAAGFHRTKAAADEFEAQAARRRAQPRPPAALVQNLSQQPAQTAAAAPPQLVASSVQPSPPPAPSRAKKSRPQSTTRASDNAPPATPPDSTSPPAFAPAQSEPQQPQEAAAAPSAPPSAPDAQPPAAAPVASAPARSIPATEPGQVPAPFDPQTRPSVAVAEGALVMPKLLYKDGTFEGLGKSAHGNIRASVVVQGGRIASTAIVKCETAYSCDWIAKLPPQVVATQDPATIDIVTGASDSSYAFQDAVAAALFRAQRGE